MDGMLGPRVRAASLRWGVGGSVGGEGGRGGVGGAEESRWMAWVGWLVGLSRW